MLVRQWIWSLVMLVALLWVVGCGGGKKSDCERVCLALCQRGVECTGEKVDCGKGCSEGCKGETLSSSLDVEACVKFIKGLSCEEVYAIVIEEDVTPLVGSPCAGEGESETVYE